MSTTSARRATGPARPLRRLLHSWPRWSGYAVALWSAAYGALGVHWTLGGDGFPFGPADENHVSASMLEGADQATTAPLMAGLGLLGTVIGLAMANCWGRAGIRRVLIGFGWATAAVLALLVQDYSILAILAFSPLLVVFAFTGVPGEQGGIEDILYWHRINLVILFIGGLLWAAATLAYQRRTAKVCAHCGRGGRAEPRWMAPASAARWGRWAVYASVLSVVPYELTRIAWYFGIPLGITDEFLRMMTDTPGMLSIGLGLSIASACGAVLTHGLSHRWGEVYPRWIWFKAGRRVPPALAIIPAGIMSIVVVPAGIMQFNIEFDWRLWGVTGPGFLFLVWGFALAAATYAYHLRRRGACDRCGRGTLAADSVVASTR